jgi:GMP synthase-like glutamine amidotransferase
MRVHWLQHADFEDLGCIAPWLAARGHTVRGTRLYAGEPLPALPDFDALILMGGPMNVDQHAGHPWLVAEKALVEQAIAAGRPVLGICLGSQLIARALGAEVRPSGMEEIGWFEVQLSADGQRSPAFAGFPSRFTAFHWHGDTFAMPPGCVPLMHSAACAHQAFALGRRVIGIQFHLEVTADNVRTWLAHLSPDAGPWVQPAARLHAASAPFAASNRLMQQLLENWLAPAD